MAGCAQPNWFIEHSVVLMGLEGQSKNTHMCTALPLEPDVRLVSALVQGAITSSRVKCGVRTHDARG